MTGKIPLSHGGFNVALDPKSGTAYVPDYYGNIVSVVDVKAKAVTRNITVGHSPVAAAVDPNTRTVFVTNTDDNTVSVIDEDSGRVRRTIKVGIRPRPVAVDLATRTVYVGTGSNVVVFNETATTVAKSIPLALEVTDLAIDPDLGVLYASQQHPGGVASANVPVINMKTSRVTHKLVVPDGADSVEVDPGSHDLYTTALLHYAVTVVDVQGRSVRRTIPVGNGPFSVAIDGSTGTAFVVQGTGMAVIDTKTGVIIDRLGVTNPRSAVVDPTNGAVYVATAGYYRNDLVVVTAVAPTGTAPSPGTSVATSLVP